MEGFGGIAMGILLGMAIGLDSGKKKFKKQLEKAIKDKAISIVSAVAENYPLNNSLIY